MTRQPGTSTGRGFVAAGALLGLLWAAGGCTPDVSEVRTRGIEQYRGHQYVESLATMRYVLDISPGDAQANYYMGLNYRTMAARRFRKDDPVGARKRIDRALVYFTQSIKTWPNYLAAISAQNEALEARGKYDEALDEAAETAHVNRGDAEHYVFLGDQYRERGDFDNAVRSYKLALAGDPDSAGAYAGLGKTYKYIDRPRARDAFRRALELNPRNTDVADELAQLDQAPLAIRTAAQTRER